MGYHRLLFDHAFDSVADRRSLDEVFDRCQRFGRAYEHRYRHWDRAWLNVTA
jgi:hypothetical protein